MNIIQIGCNTCEDNVFSFIERRQNEVKSLVVVDALSKCVEKAREKYSFLGSR